MRNVNSYNVNDRNAVISHKLMARGDLPTTMDGMTAAVADMRDVSSEMGREWPAVWGTDAEIAQDIMAGTINAQ